MTRASSALLLLALFLPRLTHGQTGAIGGRVIDERGSVVPSARISLVGTGRTVVSGDDGAWEHARLTAGRYLVQVLRLGFEPTPIDTVEVGTTRVERTYTLRAASLLLSQVVVTPGSYAVLDQQAPSQQVLTRDELLTRPQLAEDLFRTLNRLPGFSGSDFTAQLRMRNSASDELLVMLDGMELVEPFHMKDFDGAVTILDQDAVGRVELNTGGFGPAWGNRAAGLILLSSALPTEGRARTAVGLSLSNLRARSEGTFGAGKGAWLVSARRGYLDIVFKLIGEDEAPKPTYYDVLARVRYQVAPRHVLSANTLVAHDDLTFEADEGESKADGRYGNNYLWATLHSQWLPRLASTTLASVSGLSWKRDGHEAEFFGNQAFVRAGFRDRRTLGTWSLKQDWVFDASPRMSLTFGGEARGEAADYDYGRFAVNRARLGTSIVVLDSAAFGVEREIDGTRTGAYASLRTRPVGPLTLEAGLRADRHSWTGQSTVAPRFSARWDVLPHTQLRVALGTWAQAQSLHDLAVVDGDTTFARAERSLQRIVGVEHTTGGWTLRAEAFERRIREPRARWMPTDGDLNPFPEGQLDRLRFAPDSSRVRGVELIATYDLGGRVRTTAWYSNTNGTAWTAFGETPRPFQEKHSGAIDVAIRQASGWTWAAAWSFHSGWPVVPASFRIDTLAPGQYSVERNAPVPVFSERLSAYQRVDVRASRRFPLRRGALSVYAEIFNLFGRENHRGWDYDAFSNSGRLTVQRFPESFIGRLPTAGFRWEF